MEDFVLNSHRHHQITETPSIDFNTFSELIKSKIRKMYFHPPMDRNSISMDIGHCGFVALEHYYKNCFVPNTIPKQLQSKSERFATSSIYFVKNENTFWINKMIHVLWPLSNF